MSILYLSAEGRSSSQEPQLETFQSIELGEFLRSRRERLSPEAAGIVAGPRRRTKGLRREEVAILAHLSPTWYTYLEQGRRVRPSSVVIESLADALQLDRVERLYLRALATPRPAFSALAAMPSPEVVGIVQQLVRSTDSSPFPVYAADPTGAIMALNTSARDYYPGLGCGPGEQPNMLTWLFDPALGQRHIADWEADARDLVARQRFFRATHPTNPVTDAIVEELRASSPDFRRWWDGHEVAEQPPRPRRFIRPDGRIETLLLVAMQLAVSLSGGIIFHLPDSVP